MRLTPVDMCWVERNETHK